MDYLRDEPNLHSAYFFLDCHQTPFYSHVHKEVYLEFPDCHVNGLLSNNSPGRDFKKSISNYVRTRYELNKPQYMVFLDFHLKRKGLKKWIEERYHLVSVFYVEKSHLF
jgi:phosphatidylinositol glycan class B